jgi:hypothetical protein
MVFNLQQKLVIVERRWAQPPQYTDYLMPADILNFALKWKVSMVVEIVEYNRISIGFKQSKHYLLCIDLWAKYFKLYKFQKIHN